MENILRKSVSNLIKNPIREKAEPNHLNLIDNCIIHFQSLENLNSEIKTHIIQILTELRENKKRTYDEVYSYFFNIELIINHKFSPEAAHDLMIMLQPLQDRMLDDAKIRSKGINDRILNYIARKLK